MAAPPELKFSREPMPGSNSKMRPVSMRGTTPIRTTTATTTPTITTITTPGRTEKGNARLVGERVGRDPLRTIVGNRRGGGAVGLALRLILEARRELRAEPDPRIAVENLSPHRRWEFLWPYSD